MDSINNKLQTVVKLYRLRLIAAAVILVAVIVAIFLISRTVEDGHVGITHNKDIDITPVQIEQIRQIGQWEFLAISDEELVDTVRHGFFGDAELSRIYYGTLRLGIDLHETKDGWIEMDKDTVSVTLPPVRLLDENFLDEARTKSFYEEGEWSETDKEALTTRAQNMMKKRCLTDANIQSAEHNARQQFSQLLHAMGFKYTRIEFDVQDKRQE